MVRVDFITNEASHYRSALWNSLLDDDSLDVQFIFGEGCSGIRPIDLTEPCWSGKQFRFHKVRNIYIKKILIWQHGVLSHIRKTDARVLVLLGDMYVVSIWFTVWLAKLRGISVLFWGHGLNGREGGIKHWIRAHFLGLADGVLVYGERGRRLLIQSGLMPDRIRVVYNSLDHARQLTLRKSVVQYDYYSMQDWFQDDSAPVLLFVGRLTAQKRLDSLINAVRCLRRQGLIYNLLIIGDGAESDRLRTLAADLKGQVYFYGACYEEEELGRLIANADLCVSPGFVGLTAMHALGYGTPVCTHDNPAWQAPEAEAIVDGTTGVRFEYERMDIAQAVCRWFASAPDRDEVRRLCYQEIDDKWNTENQAKTISKAVRDVAR